MKPALEMVTILLFILTVALLQNTDGACYSNANNPSAAAKAIKAQNLTVFACVFNPSLKNLKLKRSGTTQKYSAPAQTFKQGAGSR